MALLMALLYTETNSQLAQSLDGSLPNISGSIDFKSSGAESTSGAFSMSGSWPKVAGGSSVMAQDNISFNASNSNGIYAAAAGTNVVRPTSIGCSMWKRTA